MHNGHLELASAAVEEFSLDRVFFVPAAQPPHKRKRVLTPAPARLRMLSLALKPYPRFSVSRFEMSRGKTTYTYLTVAHFRTLYPRAQLFFIMGSDSLAELHTWKKTELIFSRCEVIAGERPGSGRSWPARFKDRIHFLSKPIADISSSSVREAVRNGRSIQTLVPPAVASYIAERGLYREG